MKYYLAPRSNETSYQNFLSTIESGTDYTIIEPFLNDEGKKVLASKPKVFAWGCKESLRSRWEKMEKGDIVLFYKGRENDEEQGKFVYAGELIFKQLSSDLGLALWPPKKGEEPWSCVFFLDNLAEVYVPFSDIREAAGYSEHLDRIQGFQSLNEQGTDALNKKFASFDEFVRTYSSNEPHQLSVLEEDDSITAHAEAQLYLLKIGMLLNYETFCPDKNAEAFGESLKDFISLQVLPTRFIGEEIKKLVSKIDVIWFKDEVPICAFEVEHTTGVQSGLQRLCQLVPLSTKLFVVSSSKNEKLYRKFIGADPYYKFEKCFRFKTYRQLEKYFRAVSEFSSVNEAFLK